MTERKLNCTIAMHTELTKMNAFTKYIKIIGNCFCVVMSDLWDDIKHHEITYPIYIMSRKERRVWKGIKKAAKEGYAEWYNSQYNDDRYLCPPWTKPLTRAEYFVLHHIHDKIYGSRWYVVDPLGYYQISWIMYNDIRHRVI